MNLRELLRSPLLQRELGWAYCRRWWGMKPALVLPAILFLVFGGSIAYALAKGYPVGEAIAVATFVSVLIAASTALHMLFSAPRIRQSLGDHARMEELLASPIRVEEVAMSLLLGRGTSLAYAMGTAAVAGVALVARELRDIAYRGTFDVLLSSCLLLIFAISVLALLPSLYLEGTNAGMGRRHWVIAVPSHYARALTPFVAFVLWLLFGFGWLMNTLSARGATDTNFAFNVAAALCTVPPALLMLTASVLMLRRRLRRATAAMLDYLDSVMEET